MRNMILKTIFASILGTLLITPAAHADRQGGGTLKVAFNSLNSNEVESVRFRSIDADTVTFDYAWSTLANSSVEQVSASKTELSTQGVHLVKAILDSKSSKGWIQLSTKSSD